MSSFHKIILVFVIVAVAVVLAKQYQPENDDWLYDKRGDTGTCVMAPADRKDCGYGGVTKQQCEERGCCFDDSVRGVPWCFHKKYAYKDRDCGSDCSRRGCYSRRCRSSCRYGERHHSTGDINCLAGAKCCMCHLGWYNGCLYDI
ncbi:uncharacterized protein LOC144662376 [Oculina patagonica]